MRWPYLISLLFLSGAALLTFFNMLNGASTGTPLGKWYWLQADTSGIPGAHDTTRWTSYRACGVENNHNTDCSSSHAAYPLSPVSNFGTTENVPPGLQSKKGTIYYLTKTGWAFLLIALLFIVLSLIPTLVAFCVPSVSALAITTAALVPIALFFSLLAASLLTAGYVKGRNAFRDDGRSASMNTTQFAFLWTTPVLLILSTVLGSIGCCSSLAGKKEPRYSDHYGGEETSHDTYGNNYAGEKVGEEQQQPKTRGGFFGWRKSTNPGYTLDTEANPTGDATGANQNIGTNTAAVGATDYTRSAPTNDPSLLNKNAVSKSATGAVPSSIQGTSANASSSVGTGVAAGVGAGAAVLGAGAYAAGKKNSSTADYKGASEGDNTAGYSSSSKGPTGAISDYSKTANEKAGYNKPTTVSSAYGEPSTTDKTGSTAPYPSEPVDATKASSSAPYPNDAFGTSTSTGKTSDVAGTSYVDDNVIKNSTLYDQDYADSSKYDKDNTNYSNADSSKYGSSSLNKDKRSLDPGYQPLTKDEFNSDPSRRESEGSKSLWQTAVSALGFGGEDSNTTSAAGVGAGAAAGAAVGAGAGTMGESSTASRDAGVHDSKLPSDSTSYAAGNIDSTQGKKSDAYGLSDSADSTGLSGSNAKSQTLGSGTATGSNLNKKDFGYKDSGSDHGYGATKAGANSERFETDKTNYENKSTVLPIGSQNKYMNKDEYGNHNIGYETGVPDNSSAIAAQVASGSRSETVAVSKGPASSVKDTYKGIDSSIYDKHDNTTTEGYEPTDYYVEKTKDDFGKHKDQSNLSHGYNKSSSAADPTYGTGIGSETGFSSKYGSTGPNQGLSSSGYEKSTPSDKLASTGASGSSHPDSKSGAYKTSDRASSGFAESGHSSSNAKRGNDLESLTDDTGFDASSARNTIGMSSFSGSQAKSSVQQGLDKSGSNKLGSSVQQGLGTASDKADSSSSSSAGEYIAASGSVPKSTTVQGSNTMSYAAVAAGAAGGAAALASSGKDNSKQHQRKASDTTPAQDKYTSSDYDSYKVPSGSKHDSDVAAYNQSKGKNDYEPVSSSSNTANTKDKSVYDDSTYTGKSSSSAGTATGTGAGASETAGYGDSSKPGTIQPVVDLKRNRNPLAKGSSATTRQAVDDDSYKGSSGDYARDTMASEEFDRSRARGKSSAGDDLGPNVDLSKNRNPYTEGTSGSGSSNPTNSQGVKLQAATVGDNYHYKNSELSHRIDSSKFNTDEIPGSFESGNYTTSGAGASSYDKSSKPRTLVNSEFDTAHEGVEDEHHKGIYEAVVDAVKAPFTS